MLETSTNFPFGITRMFGRSAFSPSELALVCFATRRPEISGNGFPGTSPNHQNGPSCKVAGSNITQITQPEALKESATFTFWLFATAVKVDDFNCMCLDIPLTSTTMSYPEASVSARRISTSYSFASHRWRKRSPMKNARSGFHDGWNVGSQIRPCCFSSLLPTSHKRDSPNLLLR